jgi:ribose 1,5-bisphosphate isomerase
MACETWCVSEREAPTVDQAAREIETMDVRGAAKIARHAASALGRLASEGADADELREAGQRLIATRPTAVSLQNGVRYVLAGLDDGPEVVEARSQRFVHDALRARERVARNGARLLEGVDVAMTHCHSQAAATSLIARHDREPFEAVIVLETRPWRQGLITAEQLADAGLPVEFMVDAAMGRALERAEVAIVGVDTIAANGDVVNKVGTSLVSLAAEEADVPFYVAGESFKLDPGSATGHDVEIEERDPAEVLEDPIAGVEVVNPVFDVTPADRVTQLALEAGRFAPEEALDVFERSWGGLDGA